MPVPTTAQLEQRPSAFGAEMPLVKLCRIAGASMMLAAVLYVWAFAALYLIPAPTSNAAASTLQFVADYSSFFVLSYALFTAANALSIVGALGVYVATRAVDASYAALGAATLAVGLAGSLFSNAAPALISLAEKYASAPTEAQKQVYATAAAAVSATNIPLTASTVIGVGVIFVSLALVRRPEWTALAYLGFVAGALNVLRGLPVIVDYSFVTVVFVALSSLWIFGVGRLVFGRT